MKRPQYSVMKTGVILCGLLFLLMSIACSGKKKTENPGVQNKKVVVTPQLAEVSLEPADPDSTSLIRAMPQLETPNPKVTFLYQWHINGKEAPNQTDRLLDRTLISRDASIYCVVIAKVGDFQSKPFETKTVKIKNAQPVIHLDQVDRFEVPGRFHYSINAFDPDGDHLTYHLMSPLDKGIIIDEETGKVSWDIPALPEEKVRKIENEITRPEDESSVTAPEAEPVQEEPVTVITIIFEVSDAHGGNAVGSIVLNLKEGGGGLPM